MYLHTPHTTHTQHTHTTHTHTHTHTHAHGAHTTGGGEWHSSHHLLMNSRRQYLLHCTSDAQSLTSPNHSTWLTHSLTHSPTHSLTHPLTHSLTHPLTHSPTDPLTHPPTHSLTGHNSTTNLWDTWCWRESVFEDFWLFSIQWSWCGRKLQQWCNAVDIIS